MPRLLTTLTLTSALVLGAAGTAAAETTAKAAPDRAGAASKLTFDIDGLAEPIAGRLPSAITLTAPGVKVDARALSKRCNPELAQVDGSCPKGSRIGTGRLLVGVTAEDGDRDADIAITVYRQSAKKAIAVANVFGWQIIPGTISTKGGLSITFDPLPTGVSFPGFSFTFKQMSFSFGAKRTIKTRKVTHPGGRRKVRTVKRTVSLLRNPKTCTGGTWASSVRLTLRDASVVELPAPMACSAR